MDAILAFWIPEFSSSTAFSWYCRRQPTLLRRKFCPSRCCAHSLLFDRQQRHYRRCDLRVFILVTRWHYCSQHGTHLLGWGRVELVKTYADDFRFLVCVTVK